MFRVCVCSLRYPAFNAYAPYCHLWTVRLCNINGAVFREKKMVIERKMYVLSFSTNVFWNVSHSKSFWEEVSEILSYISRLRWSNGSVLAFGIQVRGFAPSRSRRIFRAKKSSAFLPSEGNKCRSFTAYKRSLNVTCNSAFRQNYRTYPPSATGCSRVVTRVETPGGESWNV